MAKCAFCGGPSTLLCDGLIQKVGDKEFRLPLLPGYMGKKSRTCDTPVCRSCAKKIGDVHVNRSRSAGGCYWDTRDLCPLCQLVTDKPLEVGKERDSEGKENREVVVPSDAQEEPR